MQRRPPNSCLSSLLHPRAGFWPVLSVLALGLTAPAAPAADPIDIGTRLDAPDEISVYVTERTMQDRPGVLRRHTPRVDGFVSAWVPLAGGELLTRLAQGPHRSVQQAARALGKIAKS